MWKIEKESHTFQMDINKRKKIQTMNDVEKFDIFNLSYDWKFQVLTDKYVVEFRPKGAKFSEYKSGDTLNSAFQRVFNFLNY